MKKLVIGFLLVLYSLNSQFHITVYATVVPQYIKCSEWAKKKLSLVQAENIYPFASNIEDLTLLATKIELATQLVVLYENMSETIIETINIDLSDTSDIYAMKAVKMGIMEVSAAGLFSPSKTVRRETAFIAFQKLICSLYPTDTGCVPEYKFNDRSSFTNENAYTASCFLYENKILSGVYTNSTFTLGNSASVLPVYENPRMNAFGRNMLPVSDLTREQLITLAANTYSLRENIKLRNTPNKGWGYVNTFDTFENTPQQFLLDNWLTINRISELCETIAPVIIREDGTGTIDSYNASNEEILNSDAFAEMVKLMKSCNIVCAERLPPFADVDTVSSLYMLTIAVTPVGEARMFWTPNGGYVYWPQAEKLNNPVSTDMQYDGFWSFYNYSRS